MIDRTPTKYDSPTIFLHWITFLLVVALWVIGQTADWLPKGPGRTAYWSIHVIVGFALLALVIYRIGWRTTAGRRLPDADPGIIALLGNAAHYALYLLLAIVLVLGVGAAFVRGFNLFGVVALPQLGDPALKKPITHWHELGANVLIGLVVLHSAAALVHHFAFRDGVLRRMMP
jgi:cytochrome b561